MPRAGTPGAPASTDPHTERTTVKDPEDWTTGDEPMTEVQASYLETLVREAARTRRRPT